jgi:hypothetical protein
LVVEKITMFVVMIINLLLNLFECFVSITFPLKIWTADLSFYPSLLIAKDNISERVGFKTSSGEEKCLVGVRMIGCFILASQQDLISIHPRETV